MAAVNGGDDPLLLIRLYTNGIKCLPQSGQMRVWLSALDKAAGSE